MTAHVEPGRVVGGRYRLVGKLAADAAGEVWRAHDEHLRLDVAVKHFRLPAAPADEDRAEVLARSVHQARSAARLRDHPHVVAVHDVLVEDDAPWTVMQLVDGRSLREHLGVHGTLSVDRAADVARSVLTVLEAAYTADVVHRNISPAAVILAADGGVLLTDFGVATQGADSALTSLGVLIGAPGFVAPERIIGEEAGGAGDLFALGVTLYQALEGRLPFDAADPASVVTHEPAPPRRAGRLAPLITRLLAKDPERRPTAREALGLIDTPRDAPPVLTKPQRPPGDRRLGPVALNGTDVIRAVAFSPDGTLLASGDNDQNVRLWDLNSAPGFSTALSDHTDWVRAIAFSPDGAVLASAADDSTVLLWDVATGQSVAALTGHAGWICLLAFSPDGTTLASAGHDKTVRLWDVTMGTCTGTLTGNPGWIRSLAFSPDGGTLAAGSGKMVQLWNARSGEKGAAWPGLGGRVRSVAFSPCGTALAAGGKSGVGMWNPVTHEPLPAWPGVGGRIASLAFGPDGTTLVTGGAHKTVTLWDAVSARSLATWTGTGAIYAVAYSPDGTRVAAANGTKVGVWHVPPRQAG